ncbi:nitroreductase [Variovorax sp. J22G21]|uniref:nitroreductase n=1 Tax=Variovorax fucosicus TaxID=3053517 RepID=UPI002576F6C9|nr:MULTISPECIES: nitroreductase [unclassified Variovorax]MDM0037797.1 nitroreductase [Variovorax sp. J22R193]MDM0056534.1 nitroreductase [Variovorax sp. J22G47]MDM0062573.1 nitroreductase [Variovorax sp. J22G21]
MERMTASLLDRQTLREAVDWAIVTRRSVRAFLPTPVPTREIEAILETASHSASGMNMQPWRVHVVTGAAKNELCAAIAAVDDDPARAAELTEPYDYYPRHWVTPYLERRRKVGWDLYGLLGIEKGDKARMHLQHGRNYRFFDAPVGLFFTVDRQLQEGSLIDYGMFLQSVMVAARARHLHTCPQAAFLKFHREIARHLQIPDGQMLVCGMSLGHANESSIENTLATEREPVSSFTTFHEHPKEATT